MADRSVKVTLTLSAEQYKAELERATKATEKLGGAGDKLGQQTQGAMSKMVQSARENREAWDATGKAFLTVGTAITAIGLAALKTGIEYNTLQQTSRAALTTLLGDAKAASAQMDKLDAFARTSPFAKQAFITAQQQMLAFGIETRKVIPYLDAVQQSVAAMGGSNQRISEITYIMSQISAASKITAVDLMQFGQRGINAAELIGSQMGKTGAQIREDITAGTLDADKALDALAAGMQERFGGAADNVKNTITGATDRVKAAWRDMASELAEPFVGKEGGGLFVGLLNGAADVMRGLQALPGPVKETTAVVGGLTGGLSLLTGALIAGYPKWQEFKKNLDTFVTSAGPAGKAVGALRTAALPLAGVLTAGAIALALWGDKAQAAKSRADSFADSIGDVAATAQTATTNLIKGQQSDWGIWEKWFSGGASSAADAAARLGQSADDISRAVQMSEPDWLKYKAAVEQTGITLGLGAGTAQQYLIKLGEQRTAIEQQTRAQKTFQEITKDTTYVTDEMTRAQEESKEAMEDARKAYESWRDPISGGLQAFGSVADSYDNVIQKNKDLAQETADATKKSSDSWQDYYDGVSVSVSDWIADLDAQVTAMENWRSNILTATRRVREELPADMVAAADAMLDELIAKGPAAAAQIESFMTASPEEKLQIVSDWQKLGDASGNAFADDLARERGITIPGELVLTVETQAAIDKVMDFAKIFVPGMPGVVPIDANPEPAERVFDVVTGEWAAASTETILAANADPALSIFSVMTGDWESTTTNTKVGADDTSGRSTVNALTGWTGQQRSSITVGANTLAAESAIAELTRARSVAITAFIGGVVSQKAAGGPVEHRATGGAVYGPGTGTSDSIPALGPFGSRYQLSNGEHIWTAAETDAVGGHAAMMRLRRAALAGRIEYRSGGGSVEPLRQPVYLPSNPAPQVHVSAPVVDVAGALNGLSVSLVLDDGTPLRATMRAEARAVVRAGGR